MRPETTQLLKHVGFGLVTLSCVGLLLWGAWHVVRVPWLTINDVVVTGGETVSHEAIRRDAERVLAGDYWRAVPRRFVWSYPQAELVSAVSAHDRVYSPQVTRDKTTLYVHIEEYEPVALWCDSMTATSSCVFLDQRGYAFAVAPTLSGGTFTRFMQRDTPAAPARVFVEESTFAQLQQLTQLLADIGWPVRGIEIDQVDDVFVYLADDSELKVALDLSPEQLVANLQTVLQSPQYEHIEPGKFVYIDLRFGNKVYVNEFGDEVVEPDAKIQ